MTRRKASESDEGFDHDAVEEIDAGLEAALAESEIPPAEYEELQEAVPGLQDEAGAPLTAEEQRAIEVSGTATPALSEQQAIEQSGTATTDTPTPAWVPPEDAPVAPPPPEPGTYT